MIRLRALLPLIVLGMTHLSLEAGGIMLYEIGSEEVGLASAGWGARAETPSTAFTNPAGMSRLCSREIEIGLQPIYPHVLFDPSFSSVKGNKGHASNWIPAGGIFYVEPINEDWTFGASSVGYFGSALNYNHHWVGRYYITNIFLEGFSFVPAVSYRVTKSLSVGLGANIMFAVFNQKTKVNNVLDGLKDGTLKFHNNNFGYGIDLGILYEFTPYTRVGLQYLSRVKHQFRARAHFSDLGPILEAALTKTGIINSRLILDVNVPQSVMLSAYHDLTCNIAIMGNVGWQEWSNFQAPTIALGSSSDVSLTFSPKFEDTWHGAIGIKYHYSPRLTFMAGFAYDSSAVKTKNRTFTFPVGQQRRYGTGFEWQYTDNILVGFQYEYQSQGNLTVDANRGPLLGHIDGQFKNFNIQFFNLNLQWKF